MLNLIIFGPPGSGKGTQSELILAKYQLLHISTGDALRNEIAQGTELGKLANSYIADGNLVPDEVIINILASILDSQTITNGVIFDGFPRTTKQAEALKEMLAERDKNITAMLSLHVEEQELISRLLTRGQTSGRSDDNLEVIQKRITVYNQQTAPVMDFYKAEGLFYNIEGVGGIEDIFGRITDVIDKALE